MLLEFDFCTFSDTFTPLVRCWHRTIKDNDRALEAIISASWNFYKKLANEEAWDKFEADTILSYFEDLEILPAHAEKIKAPSFIVLYRDAAIAIGYFSPDEG